MNQLINFQAANEMTMSSREIAELTSKEHKNVLADIRNIEAELGGLSFQLTSYTDKSNRQSPMYHLDYEQTMLLLTGYSIKLRAKVIARWKELEDKATPSWLKTLSPEAKIAIADLGRQRDEAVTYIGRATKYIDHLEHQLAAGITPTAFAKQLNGVNSNQVQSFLKTRNWMTQERGGWMALHYARDKYLSVTFKEDPSGVHRPTCYLTELGAKALYRMYCKGELPMKKHWDGKLTPKHCLPILDKETEAANGPLTGPLKTVQMVG